MDVNSSLAYVKHKRCVDLALAACRKRQSPRTGFVHYFEGEKEHSDTIPIYENFCYVLALYRQKTVEAALEAKSLLEKLLAFQAPDGNFPIFLHEFPSCRNPSQGLKIAPLLIQLQRHFSSILSSELKEKISFALEKIVQSSLETLENFLKDRSQKDKVYKLLYEQFKEKPFSLEIPFFHNELQVLFDIASLQPLEGFDPRPELLEWLLAEQKGFFSQRLLKDHPLQMHLAPLWPLTEDLVRQEGNLYTEDDCCIGWAPFAQHSADAFRFLWKGSFIGSFVLPTKVPSHVSLLGKKQWEILFDLSKEVDLSQNNVFEIAFYASALPEIVWTINGQKATSFSLQDTITMTAPSCQFSIYFEQIEGTGDFCGHLFKANRPSQIYKKDHSAYDWQIGLRTLRRSSQAQIRAVLKLFTF